MHKQLVNEASFRFVIEPDGPILIKAGESGADPTRPDMEFVRTRWPGSKEPDVYLPGSSLNSVQIRRRSRHEYPEEFLSSRHPVQIQSLRHSQRSPLIFLMF